MLPWQPHPYKTMSELGSPACYILAPGVHVERPCHAALPVQKHMPASVHERRRMCVVGSGAGSDIAVQVVNLEDALQAGSHPAASIALLHIRF